MHFIGIDMSKATFHASFEDKVRIFSNGADGYQAFITALRLHDCTPDDTRIGTEATGAYHLPFCAALSRAGWQVRVINPILTSRAIKANIRCVKTDRTDAVLIRKVLASGEGYLFADTAEMLVLKALVRERSGLVAVRSGLKQRQEADSWKRAAAGAAASEGLARVIGSVTAEIKATEAAMAGCAPETQALLRTIPGIGPTCSAALAAAIGDIRRFPGPKQLVAYIGLDCRVYESGSSVHGKGFLTKRGDKHLRHLLFLAALAAQRRIPELRAFYEKKVGEGHHHFSALCAVERKLLHIVHAVWTRGTPFERR